MNDRRTQPRFDVCLTARWQGSSAHYNVRITDLSEGGCYVDTIGEVVEGEALFLKILLPNNEWLNLQGVVVHAFPRLGFGVRFVNLDGKQRRVISSLINQIDVPSAESDCGEAFVLLDQLDLTSRGAM